MCYAQVQALRSAARQAGVPEHQVTGIRLRVKPPEGDAVQLAAISNDGPVPGDRGLRAHEATGLEGTPVSGVSEALAQPDAKDLGPQRTRSEAQGAVEDQEFLKSVAASTAEADGALNPASRAPNSAKSSSPAGRVLHPAEEDLDPASRALMYDLVAVVVHYGSGSSGHYTTFRCVRDGPRQRWLGVSDADVRPVDERVVLACEATLLCYDRAVA